MKKFNSSSGVSLMQIACPGEEMLRRDGRFLQSAFGSIGSLIHVVQGDCPLCRPYFLSFCVLSVQISFHLDYDSIPSPSSLQCLVISFSETQKNLSSSRARLLCQRDAGCPDMCFPFVFANELYFLLPMTLLKFIQRSDGRSISN
jgi:hypothetical protein